MKLLIILFLSTAFLLFGCISENDDKYNKQNIANDSKTDEMIRTFIEEKVEEIKPPIFEEKAPEDDSRCKKPVFTKYFVDPIHVQKIGQIGTLHGSGQFTVGRSYISLKENADKVPIYAPADMVLTRGSYYKVPAPGGQYLGEPIPDYALYFDAGCGVEIHLGHLKQTVPEISEQFSTPKADSRTEELRPVKFKAGDLVGYFINNAGVAAFDFMIHDTSVTNQFANNERQEYGQSDNLLQIACPYDFYTGEMKEKYYSLIGGNITSENKECGPASRDYPGTISGLWFSDKEIKKSMFDYSQEGNYGSLLAVVGDIDRVLIGQIGNRRSTFIYPNEPTYKDPKGIVDKHCYQLHPEYSPSENNGYIFFRLVDNETLNVFYSETGECPVAFPETGWAKYYR